VISSDNFTAERKLPVYLVFLLDLLVIRKFPFHLSESRQSFMFLAHHCSIFQRRMYLFMYISYLLTVALPVIRIKLISASLSLHDQMVAVHITRNSPTNATYHNSFMAYSKYRTHNQSYLTQQSLLICSALLPTNYLLP